MNWKLCFLLIVLFTTTYGWGQNDSIVFKNGDTMVGEVKLLETGVLTVETPYSDKDFKIEIDKLVKLVIQRNYFIALTNNRRRFGKIRTTEEGKVSITLEDGTIEYFDLTEIFYFEEIEEKFWKRVKARIDFGFNLAKANNNTQFTLGGEFGYTSKKYMSDLTISTLTSNQDDVERIARTEANLDVLRLLPRNWYLIGNVSFLSNTEQALDARISPNIGAGRFFISTNKLYLAGGLAYVFNSENYDDSSLDKTSSEVKIAAKFSMFNVEDFDLDTNIKFYPSITESKRYRVDYDLNIKYDLPLDFYIKVGFAFNFDNQPVAGTPELDYVLNTGVGWEFN